MEVYLIRHAQSVNNALGDNQKDRVHDPPLTAVGHQQAQILAEYLATGANLESFITSSTGADKRNTPSPYTFTQLYCSAMHRALQTSQPIRESLKITPEVWLDIHEIGGIFLEVDGVSTGYGGRTRAQVEDEFEGYILPETLTDAGWWNTEDGQEQRIKGLSRALQVADILKKRASKEAHSGDKVALVSHGGFLDKLLKAFVERLPGDGYFQWLYNTSISRVDIGMDGFVLVRYVNRVSHLPPELVT